MEAFPVHVEFKFSTEAVSVEIRGPEDWVRSHVGFLHPMLARSAGVEASAGASPSFGTSSAAAAAAGAPMANTGGPGASGSIEGVAAWWHERVPSGANISIQDTILLFAHFMRTFRKTVFVSDDIRQCFSVMGIEEPRSLLQILGTLKRDHGYLLNAGRRGEYMMNTTGLARTRELLGEKPVTSPAAPSGPAAAAPSSPPAGSAPGTVRPTVSSIFGD
jgi:hypothetical protein